MACGEDITYHGMLAKSGSRACHRTWTKHWVIFQLQHLHYATNPRQFFPKSHVHVRTCSTASMRCTTPADTQDTLCDSELHNQLVGSRPAGSQVPGCWTILQADLKSASACPGVAPSGPPLLCASSGLRGAHSVHSPGPHHCATPAQVLLWLCKWILPVHVHTSGPHSHLLSAMLCGQVCVLPGLRTCGMP